MKKFFSDSEMRPDIIFVNIDTGIAIMKDGGLKYQPKVIR